METTETDVQPAPIPTPVLVLTPEAQFYLRETSKWANFLSIIGFIICALLLIMALFMGTVFSVFVKMSPAYSAIPAGIGAIFTVIIILADVLYFFFAFYLYQFADKIKKGLTFMDSDQLTRAFGKLKSFFKIWGIVTIVVICIYIVEIIVMGIIGLTAFHR